MVILEDLHNQQSNQFIQSIHFWAFCKRNNIDFYHRLFVEKLVDKYPRLSEYQKPVIVQLYLILLSKIGRKMGLYHIIWLDDDRLAEQYSKNPHFFKSKYVFCRGGRLRDDASVEQYRDYFREIFTPSFDTKKLDAMYLNSKCVVLGLHIRRTDYASYEQGRYFFEDQVYINYVRQICQLVESFQIVVFTDDKSIDFEKYKKEFGNVLISKCSIAEDYYLMGQCDYLLSTNTTFPLVASYLGKSKLYRFMAPDEKISTMDVFKQCKTLNHTEEEGQRAALASSAFHRRFVGQ